MSWSQRHVKLNVTNHVLCHHICICRWCNSCESTMFSSALSWSPRLLQYVCCPLHKTKFGSRICNTSEHKVLFHHTVLHFQIQRYFYILHYDLPWLFMGTMSRQSANGSPQNMPPVVPPLALSPSKMACYNQARIGKTVLSFYIPATTPPLKDSRYSLSYEHTPRPAAKSPCYTPISSRASTPRTEIGSPSLQYS